MLSRPGALQWSHVFSDMVRKDMVEKSEKRRIASMEPCLFRHGKGLRREGQDRPGPCFNGAMSFQTW